MKLSCLPVSLFKDIINGSCSLSDWAVLAKKLGLDALDVSVLLVKDRTPVCVSAARRAIDEAGMSVAMVTTYPDFTNPDGMQRERELAYANADVALASALGAKYLRITAGQYYDWKDEKKALTVVKECFMRVKDTADKLGIKLLFENHSKPGAWENPDYLFKTERFLMLAEMLKETDIRINFDTANTVAFGDDAEEVFKKVLPQVETIHVNDLKAAGGVEFVVCGEGVSPIKEIFSEAKRAGFDGWVCIEEAGFKGTAGIEQAVRFTRQAWNQA